MAVPKTTQTRHMDDSVQATQRTTQVIPSLHLFRFFIFVIHTNSNLTTKLRQTFYCKKRDVGMEQTGFTCSLACTQPTPSPCPSHNYHSHTSPQPTHSPFRQMTVQRATIESTCLRSCDGAKARNQYDNGQSCDGARASMTMVSRVTGIGQVQAREQVKPVAEVIIRWVRQLELIRGRLGTGQGTGKTCCGSDYTLGPSTPVDPYRL